MPSVQQLENLVLVAGHAVHVGEDFLDPESDENWCLRPFQRGEGRFYVEHIRAGVEAAGRDPSALLVFSGGPTSREAGPRSEARGYRDLAEHFCWWSHPDVARRSAIEEFARDSFENLLFGICRFRELSGRTPRGIRVVSWAFKEERFGLHRDALAIPRSRFEFHGANQPVDLAAAKAGEARAIAAFREDPYGTGEDLGRKRAERDPFRRPVPYAGTCPELEGLLRHRGPDLYNGALPWSGGE